MMAELSVHAQNRRFTPYVATCGVVVSEPIIWMQYGHQERTCCDEEDKEYAGHQARSDLTENHWISALPLLVYVVHASQAPGLGPSAEASA